jgi:hypothetical protein
MFAQPSCTQRKRVEHGLAPVAPSRDAARSAISRGELAAFERIGEVSVKTRLQEHLDLALRRAKTMGELAQDLAAQGVRMRPNIASTGRVAGVSFELDGATLKGSDLGRSYSWRGLQERHGISYDPERDLKYQHKRGAEEPSSVVEGPHLPARV